MKADIERYLTQFRQTFRHKNCTQYEDSLVYRCPDGWADGMAQDANKLVGDLKLPLIAAPTSLLRKDSFHITAKK